MNENIFKQDEKALFPLRRLYRSYGYLPFKMNKFEEYDFYLQNKEFLVFVEVKTRSTDETLFSEFGTPATAVDHGKQQRLISAARGYIAKGDFPALQPRFDVIEVYLNKVNNKVLKINHIINAFGAR